MKRSTFIDESTGLLVCEVTTPRGETVYMQLDEMASHFWRVGAVAVSATHVEGAEGILFHCFQYGEYPKAAEFLEFVKSPSDLRSNRDSLIVIMREFGADLLDDYKECTEAANKLTDDRGKYVHGLVAINLDGDLEVANARNSPNVYSPQTDMEHTELQRRAGVIIRRLHALSAEVLRMRARVPLSDHEVVTLRELAKNLRVKQRS